MKREAFMVFTGWMNCSCEQYHKKGIRFIVFPWKGIWKVKALWRVFFLIWIAVWDKILTSDNLLGRGFDFVDWYIMCHCSGETVDHLLLHCEKAHRLWSLVFRSFGISWVLLRLVIDTLFGCGIGWESTHLAFGMPFHCV